MAPTVVGGIGAVYALPNLNLLTHSTHKRLDPERTCGVRDFRTPEARWTAFGVFSVVFLLPWIAVLVSRS